MRSLRARVRAPHMDKKLAKLEYKHNHRQMGVFQLRNLLNDKVFIASSMDVPAFMNRIKFQLNANAHPNRILQKEWAELGEENFAFEILEEIVPNEMPDHNYHAEVDVLEEQWLKKERPYGDRGYNEKKLSREERLKTIAANRK
jgi:hypothetical protein